MARIVMLEAVILSWRDQVVGADGKPADGPLQHRAPEIGEELEVPDEVVARLKREMWVPARPPTPDPSSATGGTIAPPKPHLAAKVS
jgi:hypothetical protein